jgi:prepilin-type N-terminal cleavage/methylation domain-containing protein
MIFARRELCLSVWRATGAEPDRNVALRRREPSPSSDYQSAFTLVEVIVGVAVLGIMIVSLYAGFAFGFNQIRLARENVRATQVLQERMEVIRLVNWNDVNTPGYIPTSFIAPFYADNPTNPPANNFYYTGAVQVTAAPVEETYSNNLRMVQIKLTWPSGHVVRSRKMTTFVAQYGMQRYIY